MAQEHGIPGRDTFRGVPVAGSGTARGGGGAGRRGLAPGIPRLANDKMSFWRGRKCRNAASTSSTKLPGFQQKLNRDSRGSCSEKVADLREHPLPY